MPHCLCRSPSGDLVQLVLPTHFDRVPLPMAAALRALGAPRPDRGPPLALPRHTTVVFASACPLVPGAPADARAGWAFAAVRGNWPGALWDLTARPTSGTVYGSALDGAAVGTARAGPVVTDPSAAGWVGAADGYDTSAALTAAVAALTWLATRPPTDALLRVGSDAAAMLLAGTVDPASCVHYPGEDPRWPATHGVGQLAALGRRLWRAESERRRGHLWLLATRPSDGSSLVSSRSNRNLCGQSSTVS